MVGSHTRGTLTSMTLGRPRKPQFNMDGSAKAKTYVIDRFIANGGFSQVFTASKSGKTLRKSLRMSRTKPRPRQTVLRSKYAAKVFSVKRFEEEESGGGMRESKRIHNLYQATTTEEIEREMEMSWLARSREYVVQVVEGLLVKPEEAWIIMEFMDYSLNDLIRLVRLDETAIFNIFAQAAYGLAHIHSKGIVHLDIKCGNILLSRAGQVKICDFGFARLLPEGETLVSSAISGTEEFLAPELLVANQNLIEFDQRVDIWALGVVVHKLLNSGKAPNFGDGYGFNETCWEWYQESNTEYYRQFVGSPNQELSEELEEIGTSDAEKEKQSRRVQLFIVMRKCLVPLPSIGPHGEVTREDTLDRITASELVGSELSMNKKLGLKRRHKMVQEVVQAMRTAEEQGQVGEFEVL